VMMYLGTKIQGLSHERHGRRVLQTGIYATQIRTKQGFVGASSEPRVEENNGSSAQDLQSGVRGRFAFCTG
jgi:hypothetical protein